MAKVIDTIRKNIDKDYPIGYLESLRPEPKVLRVVTNGTSLDEEVLGAMCAGTVKTVEQVGDTILVHYEEAPAAMGTKPDGEVANAIKGIILPDGIQEIPGEFFAEHHSLEHITLPGALTSIGEYAFADCTSLQSVTIPQGVTSIGAYAFQDCTSLQSVTIPQGVTSIGESAFADCTSLQSVTIPQGVTSIGESAFADCTALTAYLPQDVQTVDSYAFNGIKTLYYEGSLEGAPWGATEWIHSSPDHV